MPAPIRSRVTKWRTIILLCGKCARKLDGGCGPKGKDTLRNALRTVLKATSHRRDVRIIETRCMGVCPKNATTMVAASHPGMLFVVPEAASSEGSLTLAIDPIA